MYYGLHSMNVGLYLFLMFYEKNFLKVDEEYKNTFYCWRNTRLLK